MMSAISSKPAPDDIADWKQDARHELSGSRWLAARFGPEVSEPVRLHVPAKRYLCATDPGYMSQLSAASVTTLALQGGPMNAAETRAFEAEPYWREAVLLRQFDDQGKIAACKTPPFEHYRPLIERFARARERPVRAVLFDLDGTLINTEVHTDATVTAVAAQLRRRRLLIAALRRRTAAPGRTWPRPCAPRPASRAPAAELAADNARVLERRP